MQCKLAEDIKKSSATWGGANKEYRYTLKRIWNEKLPKCVVIGLNPSTATEEADDPTVRRCVGFAKREGCGSLCILNIFAFRSTNPRKLISCVDPVGEENDKYIVKECSNAKVIIAAYGAHGKLNGRDAEVLRLLKTKLPEKKIMCFGITKHGNPKHPLYQPRDAKLIVMGEQQ